MQRTLAIALLTSLVMSPALHADDWHHGGHHHHHHHHHHHGHYYGPPPVYYVPARPVYVVPRYRPAPVYGWRGEYPRPRSYGSGTLPLVAGGILGGVVGNEAGYGNPAAIIGGSVLGSVIGHEIGHR